MEFKNYDLKKEIFNRKDESDLCDSVYEIIEETPEFLDKLADSMDEVCDQLYEQAFEFILHCALMEMELTDDVDAQVDVEEDYEV